MVRNSPHPLAQGQEAPLVCRTSRFHLAGSLQLMMQLLVLPVRVGLLRLRRFLKIGSRIRSRRVSAKSGSVKVGVR